MISLSELGQAALWWLSPRINSAAAKHQERYDAYLKAREDLIRDGWSNWAWRAPPSTATIWGMRPEDIGPQLIKVSDLHPTFNVADFWWKDAEDGPMIDVTPTRQTLPPA